MPEPLGGHWNTSMPRHFVLMGVTNSAASRPFAKSSSVCRPPSVFSARTMSAAAAPS